MSLLKRYLSKLNRIVIPTLLSGLLICAFEIGVYYINSEMQKTEKLKNEYQIDSSWKILQSMIDDSINESKIKLNNQVIPSILKDINTRYKGNNLQLRKDLEKLPDLSYNNPIVDIMADNIRGKYINGVKSDSNGIFILTKKFGIISDLSVTSGSDRVRTIENEIAGHYNKELAKSAYSAITGHDYHRNYIFWQWFEPEDLSKEKVTTMRISELERVFKDSRGDINSLASYEFLVPEYIFMDKDILGNPLVNNRGNNQENYQFIVVQSFNITELVKANKYTANVFDNSRIISSEKHIEAMNILALGLLFVALTIFICLIQHFVETSQEKDDKNL